MKHHNSNSPSDIIVLNKFGNNIEVKIKYSLKAKNIAIKINHEGPQLILPNGNCYNKAHNFLLSKESWIRNKIKNVSYDQQLDPYKILIFGEEYSIKHIEANIFQIKVLANIVEIYSNLTDNTTILKIFLQNKLRLELIEQLNFFCEKYKLRYSHLRIIDSKTKWGSCTSQNKLSFNWRLVFAPKHVVKYLVVHELCHTKEMNHSDRFWELVRKLDPNFEISKLWLKKNSIKLHQYLN